MTSAVALVSMSCLAVAGPCGEPAASATQVKADGAGCATACPMTGTASTGQTAAVQSVALTEGGQACATACTAEQKAACATACSTEAKADCATPCEKGEAAAVSLVSMMPKMSYKVGDASMCCSKMAAEAAEKDHAEVHYVVAEVEYANQSEAMMAHQKQLQSYLMDLTRVQFAVDGACVACPDAAKEMAACGEKKMQYKVGPAVFDSAEDAIRASVMAWNAAQTVGMEYAVGDETTACIKSAGAMAEKAHCSIEYVVNGQRTKCDKQAGYLQTMARVESALKAIEQVKTNA
jgi:hypothetical protein